MTNQFATLARPSIAAMLALLLSAIVGCGASNTDKGVRVPLPKQGLIRVVNAIPDSGNMSSFLSSSLFAVSPYGESAGLTQELVGQYVMNILLTPAGGLSTTLVSNEPTNLTDQDEFSFIMIGPAATAQLVRIDNVDIAYGVTTTDPALYPPPDFQIMHAATDTAAADVYVTDAAADLATATPTATVNFGDFTPLTQQDPTVTYRVRVTPAGSKTVLFDSGAFTTANLKRSIYMLLDNFGPTGEALRVANVSAAGAENFANQMIPTSMRIANMIPDAPAIDVYRGAVTGTPLFQNVAYGTTTAYVPIPNGTATFNVTPAGTPGSVIATGDVAVVGGEGLTLYASGLDANDTSRFGVIIESFRHITGQAQFRFVAAAPSAGIVDVYLVTPGQPISDALPILASGGLLSTAAPNLTPGSYDLFVLRSGTTVELYGPERISVDAGDVYNAVLLDAPGGGSPLALQVTQEVLP